MNFLGPLNDVIVSVASFDETSVTFDLQSPSNAAVQYELTLLPSGQTIRTTGMVLSRHELILSVRVGRCAAAALLALQ